MAKSRKKSKPKSKPKTSPKAASPERNLTLVGLLLTGLGLVFILGLFSSRSTPLLATIQSLLRKGFGWGSYILPFLLLVGGVLYLLRKMEGVPRLSPEQSLGVSLLYLAC